MRKKSIQVLGSGCPTCKKLLETVKKIVTKLNINTEVEYITDVAKIIEMGIISGPVLVVDGNFVLTGGGHSDDEIEIKLSKALFNNKKNNANNADCCNHCCDCDCK